MRIRYILCLDKMKNSVTLYEYMGVGMKSETKEKLLDFMRSKNDLNINDVQKLFEIYYEQRYGK